MTEPPYLRATRAAYDTVAVDYAELVRTELAAKPLDRAMLAAFAELVQAVGVGPVADLGCGPGRVTAHLHSLGLNAFGVDLSPTMVAVARRAHPGLQFDQGSMTALDLSDGVLGGIVAWYSIIHTPPERLPMAFAEFHRVLGAGGHLLLAFQVGDECVHLEQAYGHEVSLDAYRLSPDRVTKLLSQAGLVVHARLIREPTEPEKNQQAYLLARKPEDDARGALADRGITAKSATPERADQRASAGVMPNQLLQRRFRRGGRAGTYPANVTVRTNQHLIKWRGKVRCSPPPNTTRYTSASAIGCISIQ